MKNGQPSQTADQQLRFETLLSDLSARFINLPVEEVDQQTEPWLLEGYLKSATGRSRWYNVCGCPPRSWQTLSSARGRVATSQTHNPGKPDCQTGHSAAWQFCRHFLSESESRGRSPAGPVSWRRFATRRFGIHRLCGFVGSCSSGFPIFFIANAAFASDL